LGQGNKYQTFRNHSAEGCGLNSAILLFNGWRESLLKNREQSGGRFVLKGGRECVRIDRPIGQSVNERIELTARELGRWPKQIISVEVANCLYAAKGWTARDAFIISVLVPNKKAPVLEGGAIENSIA
jgi:hypothetical protein